jgi:ABC-type glycerol-3-phosphate transport system substrate-binding protein
LDRRSYIAVVGTGAAAAVVAGAAGWYLGKGAAPPGPSPTPGAPTLRVWTQVSNADYLKLKELEFETTTGIKISRTNEPWGEAFAKYTAAIGAGTNPDIGTMGGGWALAFVPTVDPFEPLNDLHDELAARGDTWVNPRSLYSGTWQDVHYEMPWYQYSYGLLYRKDLYEAAGISEPTVDGYPTWESFYDDMVAFTESDVVPYGWAAPVADHNDHKPITGFMWSNEASVFDDTPEYPDVIFDSPETVETYQWMAELYGNCGPPGIVSYGRPDGDAAYHSDQTAFNIGIQINVNTWNSVNPDRPNLSWYTQQPRRKQYGGYAGQSNWVIFKNSDHVDECKQWFSWLYLPENLNDYYAKNEGFLPPTDRLAAPGSLFWTSGISDIVLDAHEKCYKILDADCAVATGLNYGPNLYAGAMEETLTLGGTLQKMLIEGQSAQAAVTWGHQKIVELK